MRPHLAASAAATPTHEAAGLPSWATDAAAAAAAAAAAPAAAPAAAAAAASEGTGAGLAAETVWRDASGGPPRIGEPLLSADAPAYRDRLARARLAKGPEVVVTPPPAERAAVAERLAAQRLEEVEATRAVAAAAQEAATAAE
eukprot:CAMPEP_0185466712 /NCGR_PEP_ID=MMETSP1365-20130426/96866_1 /TAXON_ID=38817 /ORGANISM="Gephyrocapsa oceanica, Strain RCC1303" /LENGTH=142 /DNA_ID=CAMNT_0028073449 /DNA_START=414 /DNA_END=840 /DNA_ORIENTATION=+